MLGSKKSEAFILILFPPKRLKFYFFRITISEKLHFERLREFRARRLREICSTGSKNWFFSCFNPFPRSILFYFDWIVFHGVVRLCFKVSKCAFA